MEKRINLLHLITALNVGGAEKVVLDLSTYANKGEYKISIASIGKGIEMLPRFHQQNLEPLVCGIEKKLSGFFLAIRKVSELVHKEKIEIIHAHMFHAFLVAAVIKLANPKLKIIFTPHNTNLQGKIREIIIFFFKRLRCNDILFSDIEEKRFYHQDPIIIPNGISIPKSNAILTEKYKIFTFICIGGYRPAKNYVNFIRSLKNFSFPVDYQILIAGKGELETEIKKEIQKVGLIGKVKLLGLRDDIIDLLQSSHVFLMPSLWEGFPISLLEAGSIGLPILATPVGNIPNLIKEETGYLAKWEEFPFFMNEIYHNYDVALKKGISLRKKIQNSYSIDVITRKHESLYRQVIRK